MEQFDKSILTILSRDGRVSFTELGREVGLSTSATQQRVRRLETRGVIQGYRAEIDPVTIGRPIAAFVQLQPLGADPEDRAPEFLETLPEIISCYSIAGSASYLCFVQVESTEALDDLLNAIRSELAVNTVTTMVLRTVFRDRALIG